MESSSEYEFDFASAKAKEFTFIDLDQTRGHEVKDDPNWDPTVAGTRFGDYQVIGLLGQGGMSQVLRGFDTRSDEKVAIKILRKKLDKNKKVRERFRREAVAVSKVRHPNIISVYLYGITHNRPFMILELLEGGDVGDLLKRRKRSGKPVEIERAVDTIQQTLSGLAAAHSKGLLHRDIKPDNLLYTRGGRVKLADFGLVKLMSESAELSITVTGAMIGTPFFMAPEQLESAKAATAQSDLYSVGVTLFQMLTGTLPFRLGKSPKALHALQAAGPAPRVREFRDVPKPLDAFVARMLEFEPRKRFKTADAARHALLEAVPPPPSVVVRLRQRGKEVHQGKLKRGEKLVLGRAAEAGVTLEGKGLSRFHCELTLTPKGLLVTDLESTNGTFLGGRKVQKPMLVSRRDELRLGKTEVLSVKWT